MKHYQISKYSNQGYDSWAAISDIGGFYDGKTFTKEAYLFTENLYIKFIDLFISQRNDPFKVTSLMDLRGTPDADKRFFNLNSPFVKLRGGEYLDKKTILIISRLCLRELMGIRLETDNSSYITFGNDFYLRIGVNDIDAHFFEKSCIDGLFIRQMSNDPDD